METVQFVLDYAQGQGMWWGLLMLTVAAMVEYIFPPIPGDSVILAGAILIPTADWPWWAVFAAVMLGSMLGAAGDWWFGTLVANRRDEGPGQWLSRPKVKKRLDEIVEKFEKHGAKFLALNRFLPAFRALFFVAAGIARLPLREVLLWAAVSAAAWNALLLGVGWLVGYNLEALVRFVEQYTYAVLGGLALVAIVWSIYRWIRARKG